MKKLFLRSLILGSLMLSIFYYLLLFIATKDPYHPFSQFLSLQPWMSLLIIGFGVQVGLYILLRRGFRLDYDQQKYAYSGNTERKETIAAAGAGGTMSGASMVACCAHHVADLTPIMGVTGASLFLTNYQKEFLMLGVVTNLLGILYMSWLMSGRVKPKVIIDHALGRKEVRI